MSVRLSRCFRFFGSLGKIQNCIKCAYFNHSTIKPHQHVFNLNRITNRQLLFLHRNQRIFFSQREIHLNQSRSKSNFIFPVSSFTRTSIAAYGIGGLGIVLSSLVVELCSTGKKTPGNLYVIYYGMEE